MTRKPNLFIIGAPKCGTTAWYEYLRRHKDIAFSKAKEPHYFSDDFQGFRWAHSEEEYLQLFEGLPPTKYTGEASVMYLFSEVAVEKIRQFQPDAKILIFLRNYADFVKSYHAQIYRTHDEDQVDLETAWKLQAAREQGKSIPVDCRESRFLQYREVCAFGKQLERVYRQFPREQVKVVIFEEWINQPQEMYGEILDFLELENDGFTDFKKVNVKRESRFRWLRAINAPSSSVSIVNRQNHSKHSWN